MTEIDSASVGGRPAPLLVSELEWALPVDLFQRIRPLPYPVLLESSLRHSELGRYTYMTADPVEVIKPQRAQPGDLDRVDAILQKFRTTLQADLPPFQGGAVNLCSYEMQHCFEELPRTIDDFKMPELFVGIYDWVVAFDLTAERCWLMTNDLGVAEEFHAEGLQGETAHTRHKKMLNRFTVQAAPIEELSERSVAELELTTPQYPTEFSSRILSNFSRQDYIKAVSRGIEYIVAGDVFQVNLSQRMLTRQTLDSFQLYQNLRTSNASTFGGFLDLGDFQIVSSSPERLVSVAPGGSLETRPIKGTRQRSLYPEADLFLAEGLMTSEKDRAENVMIVDLLRNDLSKVCLDDSICVTKLCGLEQYEFVQHLVSVITGKLREELKFSSLMEAVFPGGSITGAPKIRAMEIISEIEQLARGAYCGSLGYFGFNGAVDQNILIRTMTCGKGWCQIPVGGGIVSQSDPVSEYEETLHKAEGMIRALHSPSVDPSKPAN